MLKLGREPVTSGIARECISHLANGNQKPSLLGNQYVTLGRTYATLIIDGFVYINISLYNILSVSLVSSESTDRDEALHTCRYAVPPDSLAIEPSHSDITASTTYDIAAMSTTPVSYRGSVVDMDGELQVSNYLEIGISELLMEHNK